MGPWTKTALASVAGVAVGVLGSTYAPRCIALYHRRTVAPLTEVQRHQRYLSLFEAETRDANWAPRGTEAISSWFASNRTLSVALLEVECRTHACLLRLQWANRGSAVKEYDQLLTLTSPVLSACTSEIYLSPIDASPYRASMVLADCRNPVDP